MNLSKSFILACVTSALVFGFSWVVFMYITAAIEHVGSLPISVVSKMGALACAFSLAFQFIYGGIVKSALDRIGLFNWPTVVLAYVVPCAALGLHLANTTADLEGMIPWLIFAFVVSTTFWYFARHS
jgi:hypothetical protein